MPKPPDILNAGARETRRILQQEELRLSTKLRQWHQLRFRPFREQLKRWALEFTILRAFPDREPVRVWDAATSYRARLDVQVTEAVTALVNEEITDDAALFEEELDNGFLFGYERELALLELGGLPIEKFGEQPDRVFRRGVLLAAGVAGLNWMSRLQSWGQRHATATDQWLRGALASEREVAETLDMTDLLQRQFDRQTAGLLGNELYRAAGLGGDAAARAAVMAGYDLVEIWMTRDDALVCPICEALHLTVTALQPVTDSHPSCRCWKVPVPVGLT